MSLLKCLDVVACFISSTELKLCMRKNAVYVILIINELLLNTKTIGRSARNALNNTQIKLKKRAVWSSTFLELCVVTTNSLALCVDSLPHSI